jgi:FkbM family methyltransferase
VIEAFINLMRPVSFRGKLRLFSPLVPRYGERVCKLFGSTVKLNLADDMQRWIYLGTFENINIPLVRQCLKPGGTFVDAGANIGFFTLLAASIVGPSGKVIAFEPNPSACAALAETIEANKLAQVAIHQIGLSDTDGWAELHVPPSDKRNDNATMVGGAPGWTATRVRVGQLDLWLDQAGVSAVDLLKIDVEGHEPSVLRGAQQALAAGRIRSILIELNDPALRDAGSSAREIFDHLLSLGFRDSRGLPLRSDTWLENRLLIR